MFLGDVVDNIVFFFFVREDLLSRNELWILKFVFGFGLNLVGLGFVGSFKFYVFEFVMSRLFLILF